MKNPLYKRIPREFKKDIGKYIALFLFLTLTIGFVSGFLVADGSAKKTYNASFEEYNIEDGHFILTNKASDKLIDNIEKEDVSVYQNFYYDKESSDGKSYRLFNAQSDFNKCDIIEGEMPTKIDDISIDRMFADNNNLTVGDKVTIDNVSYNIVGLVAKSDYSALFKNNSDMMFDASGFTIAVLSQKGFENLSESGLKYCYSWFNNQSVSDEKANDIADKIMYALYTYDSNGVDDFVRKDDNQAITFTGDDMGSDKAMFLAILYIIIGVMAFVFAITTKNTIEQEATVIGTLGASGYTKGELLGHYLIPPTLVTFISAIVGNIFGYTIFEKTVVNMYYSSYSLTTYKTSWSAEAFVLTTVIPILLILIVNIAILSRELSLPPLSFLRKEFKKNKKRGAKKLPNIKFFSRFRLRIIFQNLPAYLTMFVGILLASVILIFGMVMSPLLDNYKQDVVSAEVCNYQYILKSQEDTKIKDAEKYCVTSLQTKSGEEITVYGIEDNSVYFKNIDTNELGNKVIVSDGYMEKYSLKTGEILTIYEKYNSAGYGFRIKGSIHYPSSLSVFMTREHFNDIFNMDDDYFNGYFSNDALTDIESKNIATTITQHDLTVIADQLEVSMGSVFPMFCGFAIIIYVIMIYLFAKLIIEKNSSSISMIKVLGYNNKEASRLYNFSTAIVVVLSLLLSMPISAILMKIIYYIFMQELNGWMTFYVAPYIYPAMFLIGILSYTVVHLFQMKRIKKVPMSMALKNTE